MSLHGFRGRVMRQYEDGPALSNSAAETSLLAASAREFTVGGGELEIGMSIMFRLAGRISTVVTTPGTFAIAIRFGSVDVFASGGIPLNVTAQTNVHWLCEGELMVSAVGTGTTATLFPLGCKFASRAVVGSPAAGSGGVGVELLPYNTAPAVGTGFDFSVSQLVDVLGTFSIANASNACTLHRGEMDLYVK